ncbi:MAG: ABC transporter ATP-binding protein [Desulfurococcales archaeon]|nr:ABC transporter ATP-binding protein [Desulfurococcales archaeon]
MASIRLDSITKVFDNNVYAVRDVSLEIRDGEFFVLLGPSGSGKTTLLRIIAGLEMPTRGRVYIDGDDVTDLPPRKRDVAMVFQTWALYPHMKVFDNIAFPLRIRKMPEAEVRRRVKEIADLLEISSLLDRYPRQLSGGQQQRVALARALVRNPRAWLMDEPLSNLDALLRVQMRVELRRLQKELGITTVYVTHDQTEAMSMADRLAVMNQGVIMQVGTPLEVYEEPANSFVGGFLGSPPMNFLRGTVSLTDKGILFKTPDSLVEVLVPVSRSVSRSLEEGEEVLLGFRPEHAAIYQEIADAAGGVLFEGDLVHVETLGSEYLVNVRIGKTIVKVKVPSRVQIRGERVTLAVEPSNIRIFRARDGSRLL